MNLSGKKKEKRILLDAREFIPGPLTGIGRVLCGLSHALAESCDSYQIVLAVFSSEYVPEGLKNKCNIKISQIPLPFLYSEKILSHITRKNFDLFISPYPKLPLFGTFCTSIHIIHDVLDLTYYKKRFKTPFDVIRLKMSLKKADLTWFDSEWSREETKIHFGLPAKNHFVRYPGIDESFSTKLNSNENGILNHYGLTPGYILVIGNGKPHKNLGVIIRANYKIQRQVVFTGVSKSNQAFWKKKYPENKANWIEFVEEKHMSTLIRNAFCLAQPSATEGYGFPPLEAMACGVPAIVSNIPVLFETTGGYAQFADPENPKTWIEAIEKLKNSGFRKIQIAKGLKWVEPLRGRRAWQRHVSDITRILES